MREMCVFNDNENPDDYEVLIEVSPDNLSYEFDDLSVVRKKPTGEIWVVQSSGCSCPSYEERAEITFGPVKRFEDIINWVKEGNYKGYTLQSKAENTLLDELNKLCTLDTFVIEQRKLNYVN